MNASPFGLLNVNKPCGMTSRRVVDAVAKLVRPVKVGHAGTLDPLATGVLVICIGQATRLVSFIQQLPKTYRAEFLLGRRSNTNDIEGEIVESDEPGKRVTREQVEALLPGFTGRIEQKPPQFSAVHVDGQRAYKFARSGLNMELPAKMVEVHRIEVLSFEYPKLRLKIECGSGTYIRSIGRDLGELLKCGAIMADLIRTQIGPFLVEDAVNPGDLNSDSLNDHLLPAAIAVRHLTQYVCTNDDLQEIRFGRVIHSGKNISAATGESVALLDTAGELAGVARFRQEDRTLGPKIVFSYSA